MDAAPASGFPPHGVNLEGIERQLAEQVLAIAQHDESCAARRLGVRRGQFSSLLRCHRLTDARR